MSQSCFSLGVSLKILSGSSLQYVGIRGIYTDACLECERPAFPKQSGLATWPRNWTESQLQVVS